MDRLLHLSQHLCLWCSVRYSKGLCIHTYDFNYSVTVYSSFIAKYLTRAFYGVGVRAEKFYGKAKKRKVIRFVQNRVKYFVISV